jgi:hypothetical protein
MTPKQFMFALDANKRLLLRWYDSERRRVAFAPQPPRRRRPPLGPRSDEHLKLRGFEPTFCESAEPKRVGMAGF